MKRRVIPSIRAPAIVLLTSCVLLNVHCDVFDTSDGEGGSVESVEGRVRFWIGEAYNHPTEAGDPSLMLFMTTEREYPCCNFSILNMISMSDGSIEVDLLGIYKPNICLTAIGPATSRSALYLAPGEYSLQFTLYGDVDEFSVTLTDSSISVVGDGSQFMTTAKSLVWRYPPQSFAYLCGTTTETSWICSDFLDSLVATGLFELYQFPDSGYIPYPESSAGHYYDMPALYFRYAEETDFEAGGAVLERYAKTTTCMHVGVGLSLINWRNRRYHSWLLED